MSKDLEKKPHNQRLLVFLFGFCMFSTGASGLVNEYILATMSSYILGNSIEQFSIIIAAMMLMMGVSGWVQQTISDKYLFQRFMQIEILMAILGGFAPIAIYLAFAQLQSHFLFVHYFFILSIGFLIGFEIPIVTRIIHSYGVDLKHNLKAVYAMDYLGAFVGAVIWVKFLLHNFPLTEISFIVSGFNFVVASFTIGYLYLRQAGLLNEKLGRPWFTGIALIGTAIALIYGYSQNRDWNLHLEQKFYDDPIVSQLTTRYQHLILTENPKTGDVRLYINGNTQFSSLDEARYHELLVHPAMSLLASPERVLILGGGDGLALREVLKFKALTEVSLVDLDPKMVEFSRDNPLLKRLNQGAFDDARVEVLAAAGLSSGNPRDVLIKNDRGKDEWVAQVQIYHLDADTFVRQLSQYNRQTREHQKNIENSPSNKPQDKFLWDVIIIDFPDPSSIELAKLYSREFYRQLKGLLAPNGFVAVQSTSPYHAKKAYISIIKTMESAGFNVLPYHTNVPSFGDWGFNLAWLSNESSEDMKQRIVQLREFKIATSFLTPEVLKASLAFGKGELETDKVCINSLMEPCLLDLYQHYSWIME